MSLDGVARSGHRKTAGSLLLWRVNPSSGSNGRKSHFCTTHERAHALKFGEVGTISARSFAVNVAVTLHSNDSLYAFARAFVQLVKLANEKSANGKDDGGCRE